LERTLYFLRRLIAVFLHLKIMDESELDDYIRAIDALEQEARENRDLTQQCRDEDGNVVPGCSYILPAPTEA